jgi:NitT/TauT family transport system permease protein
LWFGIGATQKISIIFISVFFYLTLMVADVVQGIRQEWIETAVTLGATPAQLLWRIVVPASAPGVWDALRTMMGVGWTTIIIAELVNAEEGLGARIQVASRFLRTDQILFVVAVIGLIGLLLDWSFRALGKCLFRWSAA